MEIERTRIHYLRDVFCRRRRLQMGQFGLKMGNGYPTPAYPPPPPPPGPFLRTATGV